MNTVKHDVLSIRTAICWLILGGGFFIQVLGLSLSILTLASGDYSRVLMLELAAAVLTIMLAIAANIISIGWKQAVCAGLLCAGSIYLLFDVMGRWGWF